MNSNGEILILVAGTAVIFLIAGIITGGVLAQRIAAKQAVAEIENFARLAADFKGYHE